MSSSEPSYIRGNASFALTVEENSDGHWLADLDPGRLL
jgi:hypothetical protein